MNPSVPVSCSSEERGEQSSWVCDTVWDNPTHPAVSAMSVGLENARQFPRGGDWDWTATAVNNPLLLSHHHHHHHHQHQQQQQQQHRYQNHHQEQSDSEEQKPQITAVAPPMGSFRQYNGMGLGFASHHHAHHHQNALGLLNSAGIRSFGSAHDGIASPSSFHPGLLYTEMPAFGGVAGYDSRSQLLGMMSMQEQHHHKEGTIFHDIKREDVCAGDFQARIGLNLGHRTYFSAEDTAVSRLYKRPRAIPPASQVPRCQAEGCKADLSNAKHYHRRHKVCEFHSKATSVVTGGVQQRFCQQCSRFHVLSEFDEVKRSCRKRLADHNRRRRKPQPNAVVPAVSSNGETFTTAPKSEGDNNNKNGPGSNETRGLQVAPAMRTESQALLNAMSLPLMLQNGKGKMTPNPNANSTNSNPSTNPPVLQANSHKVSAVPCQQQQYTQTTGGHQGPSLSMGLCNQKQAAAAAAAQDYSGLELALPWLRPSSEYSGSHHRPSPPMDILQPLMSEKADVEGFSSSIQNFLPLSASNSRELGTGSHWIVGNSGNTGGLESGQQQMFSLLENPAAAAVRADDSSGQQPPVEYLSHRRHQGGLNSKDTVEGHSDATKFSEMQSLRPFGQSIYDGSL